MIGRPFVKRFAVRYRSVVCLSVLSDCPVYTVDVLWPNGWTDPDETWHAGRPRPWPHCVRWGLNSPSPKWGIVPQFSAHCAQTAGSIKIPLGMEVDVSQGDIVLDGDPALTQGAQLPPIFGPCLLLPKGWMDQDATWYGGRYWPRPHCVRWSPTLPPSQKRGAAASLFLADAYCG